MRNQHAGRDADRNDPKHARQFHHGRRLDSDVGLVAEHAVKRRARADDGGDVVDRNSGPGAELSRREVELVPDDREEIQGRGVQNEHRRGRDAHVSGGGANGGSDRGDGAAPTDGGARGDERGKAGVGLEPLAQEPAEGEGGCDGADRKEHSG